MLKGISPVVSPDLLKVLAEMGHGDEIVFSDAHFPAHTFGRDGAIVMRADGLGCDRLLAGVIPLFELDAYATPVVMMEAVKGDALDPEVERKYRAALKYNGKIERMERFAFYERAKRRTQSSSRARPRSTATSSSRRASHPSRERDGVISDK